MPRRINKTTKGKKSPAKIKARSQEIGKELKKIYQDDKGKIPKMTALETGSKNRALKIVIFIIITLLIIFGVSFLGFILFQNNPVFSNEKVNLEIKAPFTHTSGERISYEIKYTNQEEVSLNKAQLIVNFPTGFIFEQSNLPYKASSEENYDSLSNIKAWEIGDIFSNDSETLTVEGRLIGTIDTKETVSATLSYFPANFSSEFQKYNSFNTKIIDSLLEIEIDAPSQVANEEILELEINLKNKSENLDLNNLELELNFPQEFAIIETEIIKADDNSELITEKNEQDQQITQKNWQLPQLLFMTEQKVKIRGAFKLEQSAQKDFLLNIYLKNENSDLFLQKELNFSVEVIKGELLSNLIIQGSNKNKPVNFGDSLNYLLSIQNKSKSTLSDIKISAVLESPILDWDGLSDEKNGIKEFNRILWTQEQMPELRLLFPEDEIEITFSIPVKYFKDANNYQDDDYQIKSFFETQINYVDNEETEIINESNIIINEINSNLSLDAEIRYFDKNKQSIGKGPLPPIAGQQTNYKVFLTLTNSLHELKDIKVSSELANKVKFEGNENISTGNLSVNDQILNWDISRIPDTVNKATAEFEISITPTEDDVHKILTLLSDLEIEATDTQTEGAIKQSLNGLTTNLDHDPQAEGKGLVQPGE